MENLLEAEFNPLFMLLETKEWKAAMNMLQKNPNLAEGAIKLPGFYPDNTTNKKTITTVNALHIACKHNAPVEMIEMIIKANSNTVSQKDSTYQRLPLHVATVFQCSFRIIGILTKKENFSKSSKIQDIHGRLPIHYACKDKVNGERSLRYLLKAYPQSVHIADDQGFLPIHVACRSGMSMTIIQMLLRIAPETILAKTNNGATPVHCAKNLVKEKQQQQQQQKDNNNSNKEKQKEKGTEEESLEQAVSSSQEKIVELLMSVAKETKKVVVKEEEEEQQQQQELLYGASCSSLFASPISNDQFPSGSGDTFYTNRKNGSGKSIVSTSTSGGLKADYGLLRSMGIITRGGNTKGNMVPPTRIINFSGAGAGAGGLTANKNNDLSTSSGRMAVSTKQVLPMAISISEDTMSSSSSGCTLTERSNSEASLL